MRRARHNSQPSPRASFARPVGWYVPRALGEEGTSSRATRAGQGRTLLAALACAAVVALAACGGDDSDRQDANEAEGNFPVEVVTAKFPPRQRLAQTSDLVLEVENTGDETIPDLAITLYTGSEKADSSFSTRSAQEGLADPNRPVWILEEGYPKVLEEGVDIADLDGEPTAGAETAATDTYSFGALEPGASLTAVWRVTPVKEGTFTVSYELAGGLDGKARAVAADGNPAEGEFVTTISSKPPKTRVTDSGKVVTEP